MAPNWEHLERRQALTVTELLLGHYLELPFEPKEQRRECLELRQALKELLFGPREERLENSNLQLVQ